MATEQVIRQCVRCRTCGVDVYVILLNSPPKFEYDIALWEERCPERERGSPLRCPTFAHQLEAALLERRDAQ